MGFGEKDGGLGSGSRGASSLGAQFSPQEKSELALAPHSRFPFATIRCSYKRHYLPNPWLPWLAPGVQGCWDPYQFPSRLSPTLGVQYVPSSALLEKLAGPWEKVDHGKVPIPDLTSTAQDAHTHFYPHTLVDSWVGAYGQHGWPLSLSSEGQQTRQTEGENIFCALWVRHVPLNPNCSTPQMRVLGQFP